MFQTSFVAAAAALLAALPAVHASAAHIQNYCSFDVYSWSVDTDGDAPTEPTIIKAGGGDYHEECRAVSSGGVSLKMAKENDLAGAITQMEYTVGSGEWDQFWYDLSNVNCEGVDCPFESYGLYMHSEGECPTVNCAPGDSACKQLYNNPHDDWASLSCGPGSDLYLYLCADEADVKAGSYSAPKPPKSPAPSVVIPTSTAQVEGAAAHVTPQAHTPKPKPATTTPPPEPYTEVVEVTQFSTVVVTVHPGHDNYARHIHNHAEAHKRMAHRHF